jgi:hypothetical protein
MDYKWWINLSAIVAGATGVLLFIPPFSGWPFYNVILPVHLYLGLVIVFPMLPVFLVHGWRAWRRFGRTKKAYSGLWLGTAFVFTALTGIWQWRVSVIPSWLLVLHVAVGLSALSFAVFHGLRVAMWLRQERE